MRGLLFVVLGLAGAGCAFEPGPPREPDAGPADRGWWNDAWLHRVRVTIGSPTGRLEGFPVLVRLPASFDYASTRTDGADLRFVDDAGVELAHDVDQFIPTGVSSLWVRVPVVDPAPLPAVRFWLYYGNAAATASANPAAVWSEQVIVHHLATLDDASMHGRSGTAQNAMVTAAAIGDGRAFAGNAAITLADEAAYDFTTALAVSLWVDVDVFDQGFQALVVKGDRAWRLHRDGGGQALGFATTFQNTNQDLAGAKPVTTPGWHHLAATYDQVTKSIYVDGVLDTAVPWARAIDNTTAPVVLGRNDEQGPRYFKGTLDEVRISGGSRSAAWIDAEYRTVMDPMFVTLGVAE
ncbi:MAG: DUF2341 domain-containing protein [Kofleriaceae bacterium]